MFFYRLEVGPFPSDFISCPFLRSDEEIGRSIEVVDLFKSKSVNFTCVVFQVQDSSACPLRFMIPAMPLTSVSSPFSRGLYSV